MFLSFSCEELDSFWGSSNWNIPRLVLMKEGLGLWACVHQMMKTTHSEFLGKYLSHLLDTVLHAVHSRITCSRQMKFLEYSYYIPWSWEYMTWLSEDHGAVRRRSFPEVLVGVSNIYTFQSLSMWPSAHSVDLLPKFWVVFVVIYSAFSPAACKSSSVEGSYHILFVFFSESVFSVVQWCQFLS